ncbi:hypothetical protein [Rhizobium sp. L58/93]
MTPPDRFSSPARSTHGMEPAIWRRIEVPLDLSLKGLHDVIQATMLFEDYHLVEFKAGGRRYDVPDPDPEDAYDRKDLCRSQRLHCSTHRSRCVDLHLYLRLR